MAELAGVAVSPKQVERTAEALGREVAADERERVELAPGAAPTMYLGLDAPGCRCASPRWKVGAASSPTARPRPARSSSPWCGRRKRAAQTACPNATSGRSATAPRSRARPAAAPTRWAPRSRNGRIAKRGGAAFDTAARQVVLGDGAEWIWNLAGEQFPGAIEIVDLYHAKGHLCDVAKAVYGAGTDLAAQWGKARRDELDAGRIDAILTELRAHSETCEEARKCIDYLTRNRHRMRYPEFRAAGLCVSSGVVEAGCKDAIGARLKRAGMHWTVAGANAIIALQCCVLSGRFEDFWERRAAKAA